MYLGGLDPLANCDVNHHFVYDLENPDGWIDITAVAAMPNPRNHFSTAVIDSKIYAIGGQYYHDSGRYQHDKCVAGPVQEENFLHAYDAQTMQWQRLADLPMTQSHAEAATFVHDGLFYVVGGRNSLDKIIEYNPASNSWSYKVEWQMPMNRVAAAARVINDKLIVTTGGTPDVRTPKPRLCLYYYMQMSTQERFVHRERPQYQHQQHQLAILIHIQ